MLHTCACTCLQVIAVAILAVMQAAGTLLTAWGYDSELGEISGHGTNYLNPSAAWQQGTAATVIAPKSNRVRKKQS